MSRFPFNISISFLYFVYLSIVVHLCSSHLLRSSSHVSYSSLSSSSSLPFASLFSSLIMCDPCQFSSFFPRFSLSLISWLNFAHSLQSLHRPRAPVHRSHISSTLFRNLTPRLPFHPTSKINKSNKSVETVDKQRAVFLFQWHGNGDLSPLLLSLFNNTWYSPVIDDQATNNWRTPPFPVHVGRRFPNTKLDKLSRLFSSPIRSVGLLKCFMEGEKEEKKKEGKKEARRSLLIFFLYAKGRHRWTRTRITPKPRFPDIVCAQFRQQHTRTARTVSPLSPYPTAVSKELFHPSTHPPVHFPARNAISYLMPLAFPARPLCSRRDEWSFF